MWTSVFEALNGDLGRTRARPRFAEVVAAARAATEWLAEPDRRERELLERAARLDPAGLDALGDRVRAGAPLDEDDWLAAAAWAELLFVLRGQWHEFTDARFPPAKQACERLRETAERFPFAGALARLAADWTPALDVAAALYTRACASLEIFGDAALYQKIIRLLRSGGAFWPMFLAASCLKSPGVAARAPLGEMTAPELACLTLLDNFYWMDGADRR